MRPFLSDPYRLVGGILIVLGIGGVNLASLAFWVTMVVLTAPVAFISVVWSSARQQDLAGKRVVA